MQNPLRPSPTGQETKEPTKEEQEAKNAASRNPQSGRLGRIGGRVMNPGRKGF